MDQLFIHALENNDLEAVRKIRKTDLHNHSMMSMRFKAFESYTGGKQEPPPSDFSQFNQFNQYIDRVIYPVFTRKDGFDYIMEQGVLEAAEDGVAILEMSIDASDIEFYPGRAEGLALFLNTLREKYKYLIDFRPELGLCRDIELKTLLSYSEACLDADCFFSIDLYGTEDAKKPSDFKSFYRKARARGLKLKAHVGEYGNSDDIWRTVELLELDEIQHGISAVESNGLLHMLRNNGIRLNVCPTSNVKLGRAPSLEEHPVRQLFDAGVQVSINTDDLTVFNQGVSEEFLNLSRAGLFTPKELDEIRMMGFEG